MKKGGGLALLGGAVMFIITAGCESRFVEKKPDGVTTPKISLEDRANQKAKIDARLEDIQKAAERTQQIAELVKKARGAEKSNGSYSPLDLLLEANRQFKNKMPQVLGEKLVRYGQINLPVRALSEECRVVKTLLEAEDISALTGLKDTFRITYSLQTCDSNDQYLPVFIADTLGASMTYSLVNKNLQHIFQDVLLADAMRDSSCTINYDNRKAIDSVYCLDFDIKIKANERAHVKDMAFYNSGDTRFEIHADIYQADIKLALMHLMVLASGEVKVKLDNYDETPE